MHILHFIYIHACLGFFHVFFSPVAKNANLCDILIIFY